MFIAIIFDEENETIDEASAIGPFKTSKQAEKIASKQCNDSNEEFPGKRTYKIFKLSKEVQNEMGNHTSLNGYLSFCLRR